MSGKLLALRSRIGGSVSGNTGTFPGPRHSRRDRSLSLLDLGQRVLAYSHSGDDWGDITAYLHEHGVDVLGRDTKLTPAEKKEYARLMRQLREEQEKLDARKRAICLSMWRNAVPHPAIGTYLTSRRVPAHLIGGDLRFAEACPLSPYAPSRDTRPAMLGLVTSPEGVALGLHVTYLAADHAGKAPIEKQKIMLGRVGGGMVRLSAPAETLAIAEGIETALSYTALTGTPCWSCCSVGGMIRWRPPAIVRAVIIAADPGGPGQRAAEDLRVSLRSYLRSCEIDTAPIGKDWNDTLCEDGA